MKTVIVALIGRPNTGKSTLLNALIGEKLAPVASVPNTTRVVLRGIYTEENTQFVCVDTPGLQLGSSPILDTIRKESLKGLSQSHCILWLTDTSRPLGEEEKKIELLTADLGKPIIRIYTKLDLPAVISYVGADFVIAADAIPVRAILDKIAGHAQIEGPLYDPDFYSDIRPIDRAAEIIREEAINRLMQEIPHALYARVEDVNHGQERIRMLAYVVVETESQKKIVIGAKGSKISEIGQASRIRISEVYDKPVDLMLRVAVEAGWTKDIKKVTSIFAHD
jgi:GTPase